MSNTEVIKLKVRGNFDYSKCVNAFPSSTKAKSIEDLRELTIGNNKTRVSYSDSLKKVVGRVAYGNEYLRFNPVNKKSTAFVHDMDITESEFVQLEDDYTELLNSDVRSGQFDEEIKRVSKKMSDARN